MHVIDAHAAMAIDPWSVVVEIRRFCRNVEDDAGTLK
jgi:hypothetical protein